MRLGQARDGEADEALEVMRLLAGLKLRNYSEGEQGRGSLVI